MRNLFYALILAAAPLSTAAQEIERGVSYAAEAHTLQALDIYSPPEAKNLPVVVWIHGGGWQIGDKAEVALKPQVFMDHACVFVSINYRLLPAVDMAAIVGDVAKAVGWVHKNIDRHGGDPQRLLLMGHSAGAQLAALVAIDDRYLKAEAVPSGVVIGCVPVDGDTYDIPAIIEVAETRCRVHGFPLPTYGHRIKFGNDEQKHREFSCVTHVAKNKGIPPFLILHVAGHPDTTAQAQRLGNALRDADVPVTVFAAPETTHNLLNDNLGRPDDPATQRLFEFLNATVNSEK